MFNSYELNGWETIGNRWKNEQKIITIEEKFTLNDCFIAQGARPIIPNPDIQPKDKLAISYLHRNLVDDSYNLEIATYSHKFLTSNLPYLLVNSNEKYRFSGQWKNPLYAFYKHEYRQGFRYRVHRTLFDNLMLRKTFSLVFGVDFNDLSPYLHYILSPEFAIVPQFVNLEMNQILRLRSLKSIELSLPNEVQNMNLFNNLGIQKFRPNIKLLYNEIYIVPEKINQWFGNKTLLKIYMRNENNLPFNHDYAFSQGALKTSASSKMLSTSFISNNYDDQNDNIKSISRDFGYGKAFLLGSIDVNESTYYDYKEQKVFEGFGLDGITGEIVPYNFKGLFKREITMDLNSVFKNFTIRLFTNIKKPILDVDEGIVQLEIKQSDFVTTHLVLDWQISYENILLLKKRNRYKSGQFLSLEAIKKLSKFIGTLVSLKHPTLDYQVNNQNYFREIDLRNYFV